MKGYGLDLCLSRGYFRMQQEIFTCHYVPFDDKLCAVHWLRIVLSSVTYGKSQLRLLRINEKYSVAVKPFILTQELESLYALYRESIQFDAPDSVESCLLDGAMQTMFDTYAVEVRDNEKLIAVGIFDNGAQSIAGIMNFYHPDYRKQSLGKYLMLLKINYARSQQKTYYYPGYIVSNYPKFDYKLFACESATEVFDSRRNRWLPFSWETVAKLSVGLMGRN
jgi:arginyl-tRNA--protein-N-Asp/Glu arginylyltransferase